MTPKKNRKTLSSSVKKDLENKEQIVDEVVKHVHSKSEITENHSARIPEHHNAIIPEKEKATFYIQIDKLETLEDVAYKLKKAYPEKKKKINKSTLVELGLDLIYKELEENIKSEKVMLLVNKL
jgi:hypothetical protein